jgi:hypothetical protein
MAHAPWRCIQLSCDTAAGASIAAAEGGHHTRWRGKRPAGIYLAAAGILDGQGATTHWVPADELERRGARYTEQRMVERGKVITAAGVSAGIDTALTLLAHMHGPQVARGLQLAIEYDPQPPFDMGSQSKGPAEIVEFVRPQLNTLAAPEPASSG